MFSNPLFRCCYLFWKIFILLLLFVRKKMGFIECLFLILVGCCLRKVGGLAARVPGEF